MKTFSAKYNSILQSWYYIDANNQVLGRLATRISTYLMGKNKAEYTPHIDVGDYLIVLNAEKIVVTGKKYTKKIYCRHTGYVGGIKKTTFRELLSRNPTKIIYTAVQGMLPKGPLGRSMLKKLKIYAGNKHFHIAQKPKYLQL